MFDNIILSCISMFYICLLQMFFQTWVRYQKKSFNIIVKYLHKAVMKY